MPIQGRHPLRRFVPQRPPIPTGSRTHPWLYACTLSGLEKAPNKNRGAILKDRRENKTLTQSNGSENKFESASVRRMAPASKNWYSRSNHLRDD
jgi:hypothetical protein